MKEQKKLITIIITIIVLLLIVLGITYIKLKRNNKTTTISNNIETANQAQANVTEEKEYSTIMSIVNDYISTTNYNSDIYFDNEGNQSITEEEINKKILSLLDKEYVSNNNINENNVKNYITSIKQEMLFIPINMQVIKDGNMQKYFVYGTLQSIINSKETQEFSVYVLLDTKTGTYSITPCMQAINDYANVKIENDETEIEKNENNTFEFEDVSEEEIANEYLTNYKRMLTTNPERAYSYVDENYKKEKFDTVEKFKSYITKNKDAISNMTLAQYKIIEITNNNKQLICIDKDSDYYVFNINNNGILNYTTYLDDYTINLADFDSTYYQADAQGKVKLDIKKVQEALKQEDYNYIYKFLSSDMINQNNIKSEADFEKYIKSKLENKTTINVKEITVNGSNYKCTTTISDSKNNTINTTIIIELKSESKFSISFNF